MAHSTVRAAFNAKKATIVLLAAMMLAISLPANAHAAVEVNIKEPLAGSVFEDVCGEDVIHTSGDLHVLITSTINDNRASGYVHFNPQGAKLVGLTTGNEYIGTGMGSPVHFNESLDGGSATFTSVGNFRLIGKGQAPSLLVHSVVHTTINANGELTAEVELDTEECK